MKLKFIRKIICGILISIAIVIIFFMICYYEPMIKGRADALESIEIIYYTSVLHGEKESIIITDIGEMKLFYDIIQKTNVEKIIHNTEWGEEPPKWSIVLHFSDREETLSSGVSSRFAKYGVRKFFAREESQGIIIGTNEELYLLVDETIQVHTGKIYKKEEGGYVLP